MVKKLHQNIDYSTIYIVRHGETDSNVKAAIGEIFEATESLGTGLNPTGRKQVKALASRLRSVNFDIAFSSDLQRAIETAEILIKGRELTLQTSERIRERSFGSFEGSFHIIRDKIQEKIQKLAENTKMSFVHEDIETEEHSATRLITFVQDVAVEYPGKTILVVCHGTIMRMLLVKIGCGTYHQIPSGSVENAGYFVVQSDGTDIFLKETHGVNKTGI